MPRCVARAPVRAWAARSRSLGRSPHRRRAQRGRSGRNAYTGQIGRRARSLECSLVHFQARHDHPLRTAGPEDDPSLRRCGERSRSRMHAQFVGSPTDMKIFNYSDTPCPKPLWHAIARALGVDGSIREADLVDRKMLTVVVAKASSRDGIVGSLSGTSRLGRVDIFACASCTAGGITLTFLHEIAHVWLLQFHEDRSSSDWEEQFAEGFAQRAFQLLGGMEGDRCDAASVPDGAVDAVVGLPLLIEECLGAQKDSPDV